VRCTRLIPSRHSRAVGSPGQGDLQMEIRQLTPADRDATVALWNEAGFRRPRDEPSPLTPNVDRVPNETPSSLGAINATSAQDRPMTATAVECALVVLSVSDTPLTARTCRRPVAQVCRTAKGTLTCT